MRFQPRFKSATVLAMVIGLAGCAGLDALKQRLNIFGVSFAFDRLDVGHLVFPSLDSPLGLLRGNKSALSGFGVDVVCTLKAANPNPEQAVFDGVTGQLRVDDTSPSAPSISAPFPSFTVPGKGQAAFNVTFPLRLDNPAFSKAVWKKIVTGGDVAYKIDADMAFKLAGLPASGKPDLGTRTVKLNVVTGSVNAKAAASSALDRLLQVLDLAL